MIDRLIDWMLNWSNNWFIGWFIDRCIDRLFDTSILFYCLLSIASWLTITSWIAWLGRLIGLVGSIHSFIHSFSGRLVILFIGRSSWFKVCVKFPGVLHCWQARHRVGRCAEPIALNRLRLVLSCLSFLFFLFDIARGVHSACLTLVEILRSLWKFSFARAERASEYNLLHVCFRGSLQYTKCINNKKQTRQNKIMNCAWGASEARTPDLHPQEQLTAAVKPFGPPGGAVGWLYVPHRKREKKREGGLLLVVRIPQKFCLAVEHREGRGVGGITCSPDCSIILYY